MGLSPPVLQSVRRVDNSGAGEMSTCASSERGAEGEASSSVEEALPCKDPIQARALRWRWRAHGHDNTKMIIAFRILGDEVE